MRIHFINNKGAMQIAEVSEGTHSYIVHMDDFYTPLTAKPMGVVQSHQLLELNIKRYVEGNTRYYIACRDDREFNFIVNMHFKNRVQTNIVVDAFMLEHSSYIESIKSKAERILGEQLLQNRGKVITEIKSHQNPSLRRVIFSI